MPYAASITDRLKDTLCTFRVPVENRYLHSLIRQPIADRLANAAPTTSYNCYSSPESAHSIPLQLFAPSIARNVCLSTGSAPTVHQVTVMPPSITMTCPDIKLEAFDARNTAAPAISSGSPARPIGARSSQSFRFIGSSQRALAKSVLMRPGAMQFTRTLSGPNSHARLR